MLRKAALIVVLAVFLIPAGFLSWSHLQGRRMLNEAIARVTASGGTLDLQKLIPPPPHPASNGFTRLELHTFRLAPVGRLAPPAMQCFSPGIAIPSALRESWPNNSSNIAWTTLSALMEAASPDFDGLSDALAFPVCRATSDYSKGFNTTLTHLSTLKSAATVLGAAAGHAMYSGDLDLTLDRLHDMTRVCANQSHEPTVIGQLVHNAILAITLSRIWDILHSKPWSEADLIRLSNVIPKDDTLASTAFALEGERAIAFMTMRDLTPAEFEQTYLNGGAFAGGPNANSFTLPDDLESATELASTMVGNIGASIRKHILIPLWLFGFNDMATAAYLDGIGEVIGYARKGAETRILEPALTQTDSPGDEGKRRSFWTTLFQPFDSVDAVRNAVKKTGNVEIQRALLTIDIALQRYHRRHARYPESLDALVPDLLPAIPIDVITGKPVRYRLEPGDIPKLWTVGSDGVDNDGDPSTGNSQNRPGRFYPWLSGKDAVWPRPATQAEIAAWQNAEAERSRKEAARKGTSQFNMSPDLMRRYGLMPVVPVETPDTNAPANPKP